MKQFRNPPSSSPSKISKLVPVAFLVALATQTRINSNRQRTLHDSPDEFDRETFMLLFEVCFAHERARPNTVGEAADRRLRMAGDRMVLYFSTFDTEDERMMFTIGHELRLPETTSGRFDGVKATADCPGWIEIPDFEHCVASPEFLEAVSVFYFPIDKPNLVLTHCVASYTAQRSAENKLKMAIVSALQQKALGMPDQLVFGIFKFDTDYFQVVVGIWQGDEMKIYKVGTYYLLGLVSVFQLYLVFPGIRRLGKIYSDEVAPAGPRLAKVARGEPPSSK